MATKADPATADLPALIAQIGDDLGRLVGQHVDLLKAEIEQTIRTAGGAAASVAAGGGLVAAGGLAGGLAAVHGLQAATGLPRWACYALAAGGLGAAGAYLMRRGGGELASVRPFRLTTEALGENLTWLREQASLTGR